MKAVRLALLALACSAPLLASAQWQWIDQDGRKVFSDRPPPADVPPARILKQPGLAPRAAEAPVAAAAPAVPALPRASGTDKALEEKRRQAEAAEAEKKKAQEAQVAAARAENCTRAKASKATFDSGARITRTDEKGERYFLDDAQRAAEVKRLEALIVRDCKAGAQ